MPAATNAIRFAMSELTESRWGTPQHKVTHLRRKPIHRQATRSTGGPRTVRSETLSQLSCLIGRDSTGLQALESLADQVHESGRELIFCGAREQPSRLMHQAEFQQHIGPENMCNSIAEALGRATAVYPEASKHHPVGTVWGRRSTDVLEPESDSRAPQPPAVFKEIP